MKFFERSELALRYHAHRPRVHSRVIRELAASRALRPPEAALDVACGTGHSATALAALTPRVYACDVSPAMLALARAGAPDARVARGRAEALPFRTDVFDLVTVCMAYHWFDQHGFLKETRRVLTQGGEVWVYNLFFPGVLIGDDDFAAWHRDRYLTRYPVPARHRGSLARALDSGPAGLVFAERRKLEYEVGFTATGLRSYLTTQSNVEAALRLGASLRDVDAWLDEELAPFFAREPSRRFAYPGLAEIALAT